MFKDEQSIKYEIPNRDLTLSTNNDPTSSKYGMTKLLSRISSSYTRYFNEKYKKNGQLWEGTYKAVAIETERQFNKVISYIHENPIELGANIEEYNFSSYPAYLGKRKYKWLNRGSPGTGATPSSG